MNAEDLCRLIHTFAETQQLDPRTAAWLLERILKALSPDPGKSRSKKQ